MKKVSMGWIGVVERLPAKREKAAALGADEMFMPDAIKTLLRF